MVNIFSFFTGKKKSKRSSWSEAPSHVSTAHLVGTSSSTPTPAQQSVKRQTSRFLSLRTRSSSKMIESPEDALRRQSSIGSLGRKASRRKPLATTLPRFGFEADGVSGRAEESLEGQVRIPRSTLGLENLVGPPKLRESEVAVIYAVELSVDEVKACWDTFGKALRETGCDALGLMLPQHCDPDPATVHQLLALFLLHHQPTLAPSFPSISAYAASQTPRHLYSELLRNALNDRPHPNELCEILRFSLQHLTPSQTPMIDSGMYIKFVQAEHAATYPLTAYSDLFLPRLGAGVGTCLHSVFEVFAEIASKSESNMMSGGRLCLLLGWWFCGSTRGDEQRDWQKVYKDWQTAGQRLEHIFYAWIRSQSTKSKQPTRLTELVEQYPFGESTLSTDHLPLPPPSSFPRHTLHVHLESETKISSISPADLLRSALNTNLGSDTPLLATLQSLVTARDDPKTYFDHVVQLESRAYLKGSATTSTFGSRSGPDFRPDAASYGGLTLPASNSHRSLDNTAHPQLTPLLELSEELGTLVDTHPQLKPSEQQDPNSSSHAKRADWDDFSKSGFGDAPEAVTKLDLHLSPRDQALPLSPSPSSVGPLESPVPIYKLKAIREERIDVDDAFLPFAEEAQLNRSNTLFSNICFVRLATNVALEVSEGAPIEWLLLSVDHKPPAPPLAIPSTLRSPSPSKESTVTRKRFSLGGFTSTFRRSSSMALRSDDLTAKRSVSGGTTSHGACNVLHPDANKSRAVNQDLRKDTVDAVMEGERGVLPTEGKSDKEIGLQPISSATDVHREADTAPVVPDQTLASDVDSQTSGPNARIGSPSLDSDPSHWHYIAEGGANLVFGYHGSSPEFRNRALRIPKSSVDGDSVADLSILWRDELLPKLLSDQHLPYVKPVSLDGKWVAGLFQNVQEVRPEFRTEGGTFGSFISTTPVKATLMEDLRTSSSDNSHTVLAIEIKPKWGFLPHAQHVYPPVAAEIKSQHSRYKLHQHMRGTVTDYEPLYLYSGEASRMTSAMQALWTLWSTSNGQTNSWRVFVDGKAMSSDEASKIPGVVDTDDVAAKTIPILAPILHRSGVMQRLQHLQSTLDSTDISHIAQRFQAQLPETELFDPVLLPQPSAEELRQFIDLYLSDSVAGGSDEWSLRESILAYALSATFKDCSIFITCPLVSTPDGWKLDEAAATVKVIDLDLKPLSHMKKWYDLDEKIWRYWHDTKPSAESPRTSVDTKPTHQLETPIQITRGALSARLASSSTEALFVPTPDRQMNDPLDHIGATPNIGRGIRAVSGLDASSTRALHTRTPEESEPSTPTTAATPVAAAANPASMSLSDALFISPPAAATPQAPTPRSMSLSDALFISPTPAATPAAATPASMSLSDALFISPSNNRADTEDDRVHDPLGHGEEFQEEALTLPEIVDDDVPSRGTLKPDTPPRMIRSAGPSPSPGLVAAASELPDEFLPTAEAHAPATMNFGSPVPETHKALSESRQETRSDLLAPTNEVHGGPPVGTSTGSAIIDASQTSGNEEEASSSDLPSSPTADEKQHSRSVLAGVTTQPEAHSITRTSNAPVTASDLPTTPTAEDNQHFRAVLAGIEVEDRDEKVLETKPALTSLAEHGIKVDTPATRPNESSQHVESTIEPESRPATSPSADVEETGTTPPFVTPMGFGEEVEPDYTQDAASQQ